MSQLQAATEPDADAQASYEVDAESQLTNVFTSISATCGAPRSTRRARRVDDRQGELFAEPAQTTLF